MKVENQTLTGVYYSNGKLLLSGEYLVLKGAFALALPLKYGQQLEVEYDESIPGIIWDSYMYDEIWFTAVFDSQLQLVKTNNEEVAERLLKILLISKELNPDFLSREISYRVTSKSNFNINWGIGSSSTIISNISYWADINPYILNERVFGGSGFDIACSRSDKPFLYQFENSKRDIIPINFNPVFKDSLAFIYLGHKQNTQRSILSFHENASFSNADISAISSISSQLAECEDVVGFQKLILEHENIISKILHSDAIKRKYFSDFNGQVKSLGAWGGDFILAASTDSFESIKKYFESKGLDVVFKYDEIVK